MSSPSFAAVESDITFTPGKLLQIMKPTVIGNYGQVLPVSTFLATDIYLAAPIAYQLGLIFFLRQSPRRGAIRDKGFIRGPTTWAWETLAVAHAVGVSHGRLWTRSGRAEEMNTAPAKSWMLRDKVFLSRT